MKIEKNGALLTPAPGPIRVVRVSVDVDDDGSLTYTSTDAKMGEIWTVKFDPEDVHKIEMTIFRRDHPEAPKRLKSPP